MDPEKRKLLLLAGVGVVVLYLFSRAKNASPTAQAAAADPLAGVAQQLQAQKLAQQADLEYSAAALKQREANTLEELNFIKKLGADKTVACPGGGRLRYIPGQGAGCIGPKSHGGGVVDTLLSLAGQYFGYGRGSGGKGGSGGYTPPIATRNDII
jgi:hypothetical protein